MFQNADPAQLLKGDVKTARGPAMDSPRALSVQSCYVVPGHARESAQALQQWDPSRHAELKIYVHGDLPAAPAPASFSRLDSRPNNAAVRGLADATAKLGPELQISREEAKKFVPAAGGDGKGALPENVRNFWAAVLAGRAQDFAAGGAARQPAYDHTGQNVRPGDEFAGAAAPAGENPPAVRRVSGRKRRERRARLAQEGPLFRVDQRGRRRRADARLVLQQTRRARASRRRT